MPTKKGAGGRQQNYDPHTGRFAKTDYAKLCYTPPSRREKAKKREAARREVLYNRANNSNDDYLFEVYTHIEQELPGSVQFINEKFYDTLSMKKRELDIVTRKCIIEVKGKKVRSCLSQFLEQKRFAENKNKKHIVFAPNIRPMAKYDYEKNGITIVRDHANLIKLIKEYEK